MPAKAPSTAVGAITVILTLTGWASVPLFLRHYADLIDFWTSNGWRYGFSALLWLPVLLIAAFRNRLPNGLMLAAIIPSIVNALGQVCFTAAHYYIDPGLLTFGLRTQLLFVAVGAWIMFPQERAIIRRPGYLIGAALLIAGMSAVILLSPAPPNEFTTELAEHAEIARSEVSSSQPIPFRGFREFRGESGSKTIGIVLALCSGLLFACYGLSVRKFMHGVNSVLAFAAICQYTALAMVIGMLIFGQKYGASVLDLPWWGSNGIAMLLFSAIIGIAVGHVFYYLSIARLGVAVTAGVLQLQPFLVAVGSMYFFKERLTGPQWLGGCVAVTGAMLMLSVQWKATRVAGAAPVIEKPLEIAEGESGS